MLNKYAQAGDFIYIDPPYDPTISTSNFTSYSNNKFTEQDQKNLASLFKDLSHKGCKVLLSNSNTDLIKELYSDFLNGSTKINVIRAINSNGSRRSGHQELLIRNYC
jgi:DNA adenine methylase